MLAFLPLVLAQDSRLLKFVEPRYDQYSEDLTTDYDAAIASVTITVLADGKPFTLDKSSLPLPLAVVMALQDYEFRPQGTIPHGRPAIEGETSQVTLNVPIRQGKGSVLQSQSAIRVRSGISKGLLLHQVRPEYPEAARLSRIQGMIALEAVITEQGEVKSVRIGSGPFILIEAAYNAVLQWQYRPYPANREPVEVVTDIVVNFALQ